MIFTEHACNVQPFYAMNNGGNGRLDLLLEIELLEIDIFLNDLKRFMNKIGKIH